MEITTKKVVSQAELESTTIGDIRAASDDNVIGRAHSNAQRNLDALLDNSLPAMELVELMGIKFFIKRLGYTDIAKLVLGINRSVEGALQLESKDRKPESIVPRVVILQCVCEESGDPYFTEEDIEKYFDKPELVELFTGLFLECDRVNPCILNTLKKT